METVTEPFRPHMRRYPGWDLGRLSDAASVADDAIFHVLSTARHNCHVRITDAQLHARERERESARPAEIGSSEAPTGSPTPNVGPNGNSRGAGPGTGAWTSA